MTDAGLGGHPGPDVIPPGTDLDGDFSAVYRDYFEFAWASLRRLGVPPGAEEDALQDLFTVVYRRRGDFAGRSSLKTWIFGVARKVAARHRRGEQRRRIRHERLTAATPADAAPDADDELARREARRRLDEFLAGLDPARRLVFELHILEDMSGPEIAEALGLNLNTVYSRLRLAREQLERAFPDPGPRAALVAARPRPPAAARARVWAALLLLPGAGELAGAAARPAGSLAAKLLAGVAALAGVALVVHALVTAPPAAPVHAAAGPARPAAPPAAPSVAPTPLAAHPAPSGAVAPARAAVARPPGRRAAPPGAGDATAADVAAVGPVDAAGEADPADALAAETALIAEVRRAVAAARHDDALALLDRHAREHPGGVLAREALGFRALALCGRGERDAGRRLAARLAALAPGAALTDQARAACAGP